MPPESTSKQTGFRQESPQLAGVVHRNIHALLDVRRRAERRKSIQERVADGITRFTGSMKFVVVHAILFGGWFLINLGRIPSIKPFDPFPFILLNLVLSTLAALQAPVIMMSQNRQAEKDRLQATQDYQINLMAEIEIRDLHDKMDGLRYKQWHELWHMQQRQLELLEHLHKEISHPEEKTLEPAEYKPPEI